MAHLTSSKSLLVWTSTLFLSSACTTNATINSAASNPLVGTWQLERYVDTPDGDPPIYAYGQPPIGLFVFTPDGHVSISIMRNPPNVGSTTTDPDPEACVPVWYCSYFGTYTYDPVGPRWTTHVAGGNIPAYLATNQTRSFRIDRDMLIISETYVADGKTVHAERVLRRVRP